MRLDTSVSKTDHRLENEENEPYAPFPGSAADTNRRVPARTTIRNPNLAPAVLADMGSGPEPQLRVMPEFRIRGALPRSSEAHKLKPISDAPLEAAKNPKQITVSPPPPPTPAPTVEACPPRS